MKWFVKGDIDGFFGLALDNLIQVLVVIGLCGGLLGFPDYLVYGRILPAMALSLILGNLVYAFMAKKLAAKEGRSDVCALPYGINTPSVFVYIFLVMLPAKLAAQAAGLPEDEACLRAWQAGILACLGSGLIEMLGSLVAAGLRRAAPRTALLATLSGIALGFISLPFLFRTFAQPIVGLATLAVVILIFFGQVRFRGRLPGGLVTVAVGTALAWVTGLAPATTPLPELGFFAPVPVIGDLLAGFQAGYFSEYLTVIIPMGLFNVIGSIQNIESAAAAGDAYEARPALLANGAGSVLAALFGSCFPTTIYIGHPGWKALGARAGYSVLNATFMTIICLTGSAAMIFWAVPLEAGLAIVLWIGIVITTQAFRDAEPRHMPAAVIGIMIGVGAWGSMMIKAGMRAMDTVTGGGTVWLAHKEALVAAFLANDVAIEGAFAMEHGCIFSSMIMAAATVFVIERQFLQAALWCLGGAALAAVGLIHNFVWAAKDAPMALGFAGTWALGYLAMAVVFAAGKWLCVADGPATDH